MSSVRPVLTARLRGVFVGLGALSILVVWLEFLLVRYRGALAIAGAIVAVGIAVVALRYIGGRSRLVLTGVAGFTAALQLLWALSGIYVFWIGAFVVAVALGLLAWGVAWRGRRRQRMNGVARAGRGLIRTLGVAGAAAAVLVSAAMAVVAIAPAPLAIALQSAGGSSNSFAPAAATETKIVNGSALTNDVEYGQTYPNSYLDIYIADGDPSVSRPTYVVVHGGGFIAGSKSDGDPNAASGDAAYFALGSGPVLDAGYNVVAIDYGLAPQVPYPTPVVQLGEAMEFLDSHGADYGLDMSRVVLSGGSAGGHIVGQYAAIQTNASYAEQMGIAPTMDPEHLKAMVFDSAALVPAMAGQTQAPSLVADWVFDLSLRSYVGTSQQRLAESNIVSHATAAFPPSFIADGNTGTFPDQAAQLSDKLTSVGVANELDVPPLSEAVLGHGFMSASSPSTDAYNKKKIAFLSSIIP